MSNLPTFNAGGDFVAEVTATKLNAICDEIKANKIHPGQGLRVTTTPAGTTLAVIKSPPLPRIVPPFHLELLTSGTESAPIYHVTVNRGFVIERIPNSGNALALHLPANIYAGDELAQHPITAGQGVFVEVKIGANGIIGGSADPVNIVVGAANLASSHYVPDVGDGAAGYSPSGTAAVKYYLLGVLDATGAMITTYCHDSHISHWIELASFKKGAGTHDIFSYYDAALMRYVTKGLSEDSGTGMVPVTITRDGESLKFGVAEADLPAATGEHLDLVITRLYYTTSGGNLQLTGSGDANLYRWRHGLYVGKFAVDAGALDGDGALTIDSDEATHLQTAPA